MKKAIHRHLGIIIALLFLVGAIGTVVAQDAHNVFAGQVILLSKIPPTYFNTKDGFVRFLRQNKITVLHANAENEWDFKSMAFFRKPLGDYEVEMVFFDVTSGKGPDAKEFKDSFTQYTQDRQSRSLLGRAILTRPRFDANRKYIVEVQSHGKTVASGSFETKGATQAQLDEQKRIDNEMQKMQKSMEELQKKAQEQENQQKEKEKNKDAAAGDSLF